PVRPFIFHPTAPTLFHAPSLHDALPISRTRPSGEPAHEGSGSAERPKRHNIRRSANARPACAVSGRAQKQGPCADQICEPNAQSDRKSTRLNSSHVKISYAVFCLKKKKQ